MILLTLRINDKPMTLIDISNYIRCAHKKNIRIDDVLLIILKELRYEIGIKEGKVVKYYLH